MILQPVGDPVVHARRVPEFDSQAQPAGNVAQEVGQPRVVSRLLGRVGSAGLRVARPGRATAWRSGVDTTDSQWS